MNYYDVIIYRDGRAIDSKCFTDYTRAESWLSDSLASHSGSVGLIEVETI